MLNHPAGVDRAFRALADPTRRHVVEQLSDGPATVARLARSTDLTLAAVLQHVQVLERSGLVTTSKIGRSRTCELDQRGLKIAERWIADRRRRWHQRLERLSEFIDGVDHANQTEPPTPDEDE